MAVDVFIGLAVAGGIVAAGVAAYAKTSNSEPHNSEDEEVDEEDEMEVYDVQRVGPTLADKLDKAKTLADDLRVPHDAADDEFTAIDGIGDYTVTQIREDIGSVDTRDKGNEADE